MKTFKFGFEINWTLVDAKIRASDKDLPVKMDDTTRYALFCVILTFFIVFGVIFFGLCVIFFINLSIDEPDGKEDKELLTLKTIR